MPAFDEPVERRRPRPASARSGWLKCVFMKIGWYFCTISQNSGVMRSGRCDVMRLPSRMISTCGIARSRWKMYSSRRSLSIIGSPPDRMTSRISVCCRDVLERRLVLVERDLLGIADLAAPRAEAAVARADRAHEEQHAVRIPVRDVRHRRVAVLVERVDHAVDDRRAPATVGTYWFQHRVADLLDLRRATRGVMRIWKLSNAGCSASTSISRSAASRRTARPLA